MNNKKKEILVVAIFLIIQSILYVFARTKQALHTHR